MAPTAAVRLLLEHSKEAETKHGAIADRPEALARIEARLQMALVEHNSGVDATGDYRVGRRLLQVAGLCVRACVDLNLPEEPPSAE